MNARVANPIPKTAAPVWWHGPEGELGAGPVQWDLLWGLLLLGWLPGSIALLWVLPHSWPLLLISFCSIFVIVRRARLDGTPALVNGATKHWGMIFGIASAALYALRLLGESSSFYYMLFVLAGVGYIYATTIYFTSQRLIAWEPPRSKTVAPRDIPLADLKKMREELERAKATLPSLPVFDADDDDLAAAWAAREPMQVAKILHEGNETTHESWKRAITLHNRAATYVDHARSKLNQLLTQAEQRLAQLNLDDKPLEIERSKLGQVEFARAIPQKLTVLHINRQFAAIAESPGRMSVQMLGRLPLPVAIPAIPLAFVMGVVMHFTYKSRVLRRLKDTEGQLVVNAEAARGDIATIQTILTTRTIPQFDGMMVVIERLDSGLHDLLPDAKMPVATQRDKALQLAFVMLEGKKLVATLAGD